MLTRLVVRNFKRFREVDIELGETVLLIGPNNSGKTSALQALALWELGVRRWQEKRGSGEGAPKKRYGVVVNRRDLIALPVPEADLLWRDLHVRTVEAVGGKPQTSNIRIEIEVDGITEGRSWHCGLEFDYANAESLYCRPLRTADGGRQPVPEQAPKVRVAFLPPMSGLAAREFRQDPGAIQVLIGEGQTAQVLRNLCLAAKEAGGEEWDRLVARMSKLFGVQLGNPRYIQERGEIELAYREKSGTKLDLSSSGRGLQQTLLLLAYLRANAGAVLLLDEPDAHLEILRQRQIYDVLTEAAAEQGSQIIAASHSEVLLNEAAARDIVVAFVGKPHRIDDRGSQVAKSLKEIGFEDYYQAEQQGWVLYVEGATDLAILRALAQTLDHPAQRVLERPFIKHVGNQPSHAAAHFFGLKEARPDLVGFALFDRLDRVPDTHPGLASYCWQRREIENYLAFPEVLLAYANELPTVQGIGPLFEEAERVRFREVMQEWIDLIVPAVARRDPSDKWWRETKASGDFLDRVFEGFFDDLGWRNLMQKSDYHRLAPLVPKALIDPEVRGVLDRILEIAERAKGGGTD